MNKKDMKFLLPLMSMLVANASAMTTVDNKNVDNSTKLSALKTDLFGKVAPGDSLAAQRIFEASEDLKVHICDLFKVTPKDGTLLGAFSESQNVEVNYDFIEASKNPAELGKLMSFLSNKGYREGAVALAGEEIPVKAKKNAEVFWRAFMSIYNQKDGKDILENLKGNGLDLGAKTPEKKEATKAASSDSSESEENVAPLKITAAAYNKYKVVEAEAKDIKALGSYISRKYANQWYVIGVKHLDIMITPVSKKVADKDDLGTVKFIVDSAKLEAVE